VDGEEAVESGVRKVRMTKEPKRAKMTNDQGAKSQSNPNDQAPKPKEEKIFRSE
jgi:hypothetical protein